MSDARISYTSRQDWIDSTPYDVNAVFPADTSGDQFLVMLRQLLAERFGLVVLKDVRSMAAYELVVARRGPQLKPAADEKGSSYILPGHIVGRYVTMGWLADIVARQTGRPVVDTTKIDGHFDLDLRWAPDGANQDAGPSVYTALDEQLGLKLNPGHAGKPEHQQANREPRELRFTPIVGIANIDRVRIQLDYVLYPEGQPLLRRNQCNERFEIVGPGRLDAQVSEKAFQILLGGLLTMK